MQRIYRTYLTICFFSFLVLSSSCATKGPSEKEKLAEYKLEVALSLIAGRNYPSALKELLEAEELDSKNAGVQAAIGHVYFVRERYDQSEKYYLKALKIRPNYTDAKNALARSYLELGRLSRAEELLKEAANDLLYQNYHVTYSNLGILAFKKNNFDLAVEYFKKSLDKDRENCATHVYLGRSYMENKLLPMAISQFEKSISFCSAVDSDSAHYYSAIAYYRNRQTAKALSRFEETVSLFPNGSFNEKSLKMIEIIKKSVQ